MARQTGAIKITGTIDGLCFYKMQGNHYVRMKSSLTGKRVKRDPSFALTMAYAGLLGQASKIASAVYAKISKEQKIKGLYRTITGQAMRLLKSGVSTEAVYEHLIELYIPQPETGIAPADENTLKAARIACGEFVLKEIFGDGLLTIANFLEALPLRYNSG